MQDNKLIESIMVKHNLDYEQAREWAFRLLYGGTNKKWFSATERSPVS